MMKKLFVPTLLLALCGSVSAFDQTDAQKEAYWLKKYRANPRDVESLVTLAQVREDRAKWQSAFDTWRVVAQGFGPQLPVAFNGIDAPNYAQLADWWRGRILNRRAGSHKASATQRAASDREWERIKSSATFERAGRVDMNDDNIPEILYFIRTPNSQGKTIRQLRADKWNGKQYVSTWKSGDRAPASYSIIGMKDWPRVIVDYTRSGDVNPTIRSLYFNSEDFMEVQE